MRCNVDLVVRMIRGHSFSHSTIGCMSAVDRQFHPSAPAYWLQPVQPPCYWIHFFRQLPPKYHSSPVRSSPPGSHHAVQLHRHGLRSPSLCDICCICINGERHVPLLGLLCAAFCASVRISNTRSSIALKPDRSILVLLRLDSAFWSSSTASSGET